MKWFKTILNKAENIGEVLIYGEIEDMKFWDDDVTPKEIREQLDELKDVDHLNIYVNSPGGNVFAGVAIYNAIKRFDKPKTAYVDGIAASISSLIVLAADRVVMPFNAMLMIHNMSTIAAGDAKFFRELADKMERIQSGTIVSTYKEKTGLDEEKLLEMMAAETWMNGKEALELGFADEVEEEMKIAAFYQGDNIKFQDVEVHLNKFRAFPKAKFIEHKPETKMSLEQRHKHEIFMLSANN